jgi:hypothetical protein
MALILPALIPVALVPVTPDSVQPVSKLEAEVSVGIVVLPVASDNVNKQK